MYLALQISLLTLLTTFAPTYRLRILPVPEGCISYSDFAHGLSESGSAIGNLQCGASTENRAILWDARGFHVLETLGGRSSYAFGMSRDGATVLGAADNGVITPDGQTVTRPVLWTHGTIVELETLGGPFGATTDVNSRGTVVGVCEPAEIDPRVNRQPFRACRWDGAGAPSDLGDLGGPDAEALGINRRGWVVGWASTTTPASPGDGFAHVAFLHDSSGMTSLGTLGGEWSEAFAVNDAGEIVGSSETAGVDETSRGAIHAFVWRRGTMRELGTTRGRSMAYDINDRGDIVGNSLIPVTGQRAATIATLWHRGATLNLNDLVDSRDGWALQYATAINDSGSILVQAYRDGAVRIGILEPRCR